jgi:hypothetical protein
MADAIRRAVHGHCPGKEERARRVLSVLN